MKQRPKLTLNKEGIKLLNSTELGTVGGGSYYPHTDQCTPSSGMLTLFNLCDAVD